MNLYPEKSIHRRTTLLVIPMAMMFCCSVVAQGQPASNQRQQNPQQQNGQGQQRNAQGQQQNPNTIQIVAVVNGQTVTRDQLAQQCTMRFGEDVLESIVNKMLIMNQIQQRGISITEADVMDELQRQAEKYGLSADRYIALIVKERGISLDKLKNDITWMQLALRQLAAQKIQVSPNEIAERMQFEFGSKVQVRAIASNTRQDAEQILAYVTQSPAEFDRVAKEKSVDKQSASVRGLLPPIRRNMGEPVLENAAFNLEPGQISPIIEAGEQFIVMKCEQIFPAAQLPPEQRSIAEQRIDEQLREEKLGTAASELFQQLQESTNIVNVYNDPKSREQSPGVAATINGTPITLRTLYEECITRFGRDVLKAEINRLIVMQQLQRNSLTVADSEIQSEISRAAEVFGFVTREGQVDIEKWIAYVTKGNRSKLDIYVQDEVWPTTAVRKLVEPNVQVTQEDLQRGFISNFGERVECLAIVLSDQRLAQRVWQQAKADPTEESFGKLANQYSIEPASRANFGQVPPIQMYGGRPKLEEEAFKLKAGEISGLVEVGQNWVMIYCQGRTTPEVQDFDAVKDELHKNIMEKKLRIAMAEEFDRLTQAAQVDNFLEGTSQPGATAVQSARQNMNSGRQ